MGDPDVQAPRANKHNVFPRGSASGGRSWAPGPATKIARDEKPVSGMESTTPGAHVDWSRNRRSKEEEENLVCFFLTYGEVVCALEMSTALVSRLTTSQGMRPFRCEDFGSIDEVGSVR